jgi:1-acyl-sn-glycerol-3-phosphate acyltransferase
MTALSARDVAKKRRKSQFLLKTIEYQLAACNGICNLKGVSHMHSLDCRLNQTNHSDFGTDSTSNAYNLLFLLTGVAIAIYTLARVAESNNRLNLDNRFARIIAGALVFIMNAMHTNNGDLEIATENKLIAMGPHRTGWEAIAVASKMKGTAPRFFATDAFNAVPGIASFLKMFKVIPVESKPMKNDSGRSANAKALDEASNILKDNGCVAMFPQGNFARLGQESPIIYPGAAKLALSNKIPIQVIRLDGFWSLQNPIIPIFIRNNAYYRSFLSMLLHMNNVRVQLCCEIDFHLLPENDHLSEEEKTENICAQLYAYYRRTEELSVEEVDSIKTEIADGTHLLIWKNKVQQEDLKKQLTNAKSEGTKLEATTFVPMSI